METKIIDGITKEVVVKKEKTEKIDAVRILKIDSEKQAYPTEYFGPYAFKIYLTEFGTADDRDSRWDFEIYRDDEIVYSDTDFIAYDRDMRHYVKVQLLRIAEEDGAHVLQYRDSQGQDKVSIDGWAKTARDLRQKIGLSQRAIADNLSIPLRTWEAWETGKYAPPLYVEKLIIEKLERMIEEHTKAGI